MKSDQIGQPIASTVRPLFLGCACDGLFVEPTAVMLSSVDANGDVPDATILVAGFGLDEKDRSVLKAGAGRMAASMRFIDLAHENLSGINAIKFTQQYPLIVLGRLFIADHIHSPNARLITLDSDMIVNASLRPLFELDLESNFFAAIHDPPRHDDLSYFNSGLILTDVDAYQFYRISSRCLLWLAERERPNFPDQDALNAMVGDNWYRLDRSWNSFAGTGEHYELQDYERAKVAHFAGPKPWSFLAHLGAPLYSRYLERLRVRQDRLSQYSRADRDFIATCYEVFLGREVDSDIVFRDRAHWPVLEVVQSVINSTEFASILSTLFANDSQFLHGIFSTAPTTRQKVWAADRLNVRTQTMERIEAASTWRQLLVAIVQDDAFLTATGLKLPKGVTTRS